MISKTFNLQIGGFGTDILTGGPDRDILIGETGNDTLDGAGGRDFLFGGIGKDVLIGGDGNDRMYGGTRNDIFYGGEGDDRFFGGFGRDTVVYGGSIADYSFVLTTNENGRIRADITDSTGDLDRLRSIESVYFAADDYTVDLTGRNNAVLARDDEAAADADGALLDMLTANDFDFDGDTLTITGLDTSELTGRATLNADGTVSYFTDGAYDGLAAGETAQTTLHYTVSDGQGSTDTASVTITITGRNDAPVLTVADATVAEGETAVTTALAVDADGDTVTFSLIGADASHFMIDGNGQLAFAALPDFEVPADADGDNVYEVTILASDGSLLSGEAITVTVTDVDESKAWISEFHYDNAGSDVGEFIEVSGTAGLDLTGWSLVLYNGSNGTPYNTIALTGVLGDTNAGFGFNVTDLPANGLQNGAPDGIALVDADGEVVELISYEGTLTAVGGPADGMTSQDVGVAEDSQQPIGGSIQRVGVENEFAWAVTDFNTKGNANSATPPAPPPMVVINELHYDNDGSDTGEFIEIAGDAGADLSGWSLVLYNGSNGTAYNTIALSGVLGDDAAGVGFHVTDLPANGLQNGAPDGLALVNAEGEVIEFLSYEGTLTATDGPAAGMTSTDIGAEETGSQPVGGSIQRQDDDTWLTTETNTKGAQNDAGDSSSEVTQLVINEFHYDNFSTDVGEFIEVAGTPGGDLTGWTIALYNGNDGAVYDTLTLTGTLTDDADTGYATVDAPNIQNGSPDGIALVDPDGTVVEFLSYEGTLTATDGPAAGMTSTDVGVEQTPTTDQGQSLQRQPDGSWELLDETPNAVNNGGDIVDPPATTTLISAVQGSGETAALDGQTVQVEAVVTAVVSNGFYLQEEDSDADADSATSEGIFVFTNTAPTVSVSATYQVSGLVSEFFGLTQITAETLTMIGLGTLPTAANLTFPFSTDLEAFEGMQVSVDTAADANPLTVIETFNFDRFGEMVLSDGPQIQPTQIYDAQTEQAEIQALLAENAATRLIIDDGSTSQNPSTFGYIANDTAGDDGDGILGSGDTFSADGPTLRIGAELDAPVNGILTYSFGDYRVVPTETLSFDPATNEGAREDTPPTVGGDLKVVSFNALNYFTTLGERGAFTADDLDRQTEKLVNALVALDGDIVGLQEIENNGFGTESAVATLVAAVNDRLGATVYGFVDPTTDGGPMGTDAITVGFMYKLDVVDVVDADFLIFDNVIDRDGDGDVDADDQLNRPAVAAVFEDADGEQITIANNHFKSKGPSGATGDNADQGDGQGAWNPLRTDAAEQLTTWLASGALNTTDPDILIIGDLNAYSQEDPIQAIEAAGYDNLLETFVGAENAFSFVFNGQQGALDHAMATTSLQGQVTGVAEWHINAQEPDLLSYNSRFTDAGFYNGDDVFSSSDHDPLIIGLSLGVDELLLT